MYANTFLPAFLTSRISLRSSSSVPQPPAAPSNVTTRPFAVGSRAIERNRATIEVSSRSPIVPVSSTRSR